MRNDHAFRTVIPHSCLAIDDQVIIMREMRLIRLLVSLSSGMLPISCSNDETDDVRLKETEIFPMLTSSLGVVVDHVTRAEK